MDLFKERKKSRKKKGSNRNPTVDEREDVNPATSKNVHGNKHVDKINNDSSSEATKVNGDNGGQSKQDSLNNSSNGNRLDSLSSSKKKKKKKKEKHGDSNTSIDEDESEQDVGSAANQTQSLASSSPLPMPKCPPPGFQDSISSLNIDDNDPRQNDNYNQSQASSMPLNCHLGNTYINPMNQNISQRYIIIPKSERPDPSYLSQNPSLAVSAAKSFIELYYSHITHGLSSELATYYTSHAQKSISVGGAHHVVATRGDIMLQLSKFSGSNFLVRGVVSQDTFDTKGAHILITGIVQTTLNDQTAFAHSVSLVRKQTPLYSVPSEDSDFSFLIHNDALSLLTSSELMSKDPHP